MSATMNCDLGEAEFRLVSDMVYRHCGINLHDGKKDLVWARLAKRVRATGSESASAYVAQVRANPGGPEFAHLIDAVSTNLTSFFREQKHFDFLSTSLLPSLLGRKFKRGERRIRGWSAGCSSGEEPYSLAVTLLEAMGDGAEWDGRVLATDISRPVLKKGRLGEYPGSRLAAVPPALRAKYFARRPGTGAGQESYAVGDAVRRLVRFNYLNLMQRWPFTGRFDFIFCRNVMIYFDKPTQERLVNRYHDILAPGGLLFTGHSESLTGVNHKFKYVQPTIYARS